MKKIIALLLVTVMAIGIVGCGKKNDGNTENSETAVRLEGTCSEILAKVYENADLDPELKEAMQYYENIAIPEESKEYILGTTEVLYSDSVYSAPMMSSIAYQCVVLRVEEGQDVETAKQLLLDNADPIKWVCVEAESVVVENVGDVILYIMCDNATADAIKTAFLALNE